MKLIITKDYDEMSLEAAKLIAEQVSSNKESILGLATGSTPLGTYNELIRRNKEENLDFSKVKSFNLDEYIGLPPDNDQSYFYFMYNNLFKHINIKPDAYKVPSGISEYIDAYCLTYDKSIEDAGGVDLQLLGLGNNGHIAFNEPASFFADKTNTVALTESTIEANARFFENKDLVPKKAITMGIGTIMRARKIVLIASGKSKAQAVKALFEGPIAPDMPASALRFHQDCVIIVDKDAASLL